MELEKLEVQNFRQFYGTQSLEFSQDDDKNITVVHGSNGSGKTTLLNAFLWLFYEDITLPKSSQIASERAMAEASANKTISVRVTLEFSHEGRSYTAERRQEYLKQSDDDLAGVQDTEQLTLEYIDQNGNHKTRNNPGSALKQIMPERLREIFFFDGETIDELTAEGGQDKVQSAIRNIMGLEILERSIRHLGHVEGEFEAQIEKHGSDELSELISRKQDTQERLEQKKERREEVKESKRKTEAEITDVEAKLAELEGSRELQQERKSLTEERTTIQSDIRAINDDLSKEISENGHVPLAMDAVEKTARMLQDKRQQGEIPSEIKTTLVDDLLEMEECICGRPLEPGTDHYEKVASWKRQAGSSELEEVAMNIAGRLTEIGSEQEALYEDIERLLDRRGDKRDQLQRVEERIDEISDELSDVDTEDVKELEERREALDDDIEEYTREVGRLDSDIDDLEDKLGDLEDEISEAREENEKADLARRRAQTTAYVSDLLDQRFNQYQDEVRKSVNDRVNDIFQDIIKKDYYAQITDNYELEILKDIGEKEAVPVAQSTGERQVASLSFISTLISLARERYESDENATHFTGGIYPMIMDSPFGYLDPDYQQGVSSVMPEMAKQVVVLVTQSQWSEAVAGEMSNIAGKRYFLEYNDPAEEPETEYEWTQITAERGN